MMPFLEDLGLLPHFSCYEVTIGKRYGENEDHCYIAEYNNDVVTFYEGCESVEEYPDEGSSSLSSLSSSTPQKTPLSVSFSKVGPVVISDDCGDSSPSQQQAYRISDRWYKNDELREFKKGAIREAKTIEKRNRNRNENDDITALLGLEGRTRAGMKRRKGYILGSVKIGRAHV